MFETMQYKRRVGKLLKRQHANVQAHTKKIQNDRKSGKKGVDIQAMESLAYHEYDEYRDDIDALRTSYLAAKAHKLVVPTPDRQDKEMWYQSGISGRTFLTTKGYDKLCTDITRRKKDNRDVWLPWVVTLTGLIAAATGFIAVLKK